MVALDNLIYKPCLEVPAIQSSLKKWAEMDWSTASATLNLNDLDRLAYVTHATYMMGSVINDQCSVHMYTHGRRLDGSQSLYYASLATFQGVQAPAPADYTTKQKIADLEGAWQTLHQITEPRDSGAPRDSPCHAWLRLIEEVEHFQHTLEVSQ
jgi:hypothetical protein